LTVLAAAYPEAEIVLLGVPAFARLLADRPVPVDRVVTIPPTPGVYEAGGAADWAAFAAAEVGPVDLGVQLHGGGRNSSPFVLRLAPRWAVGSRTLDAPALTRWLRNRYYQNEVMRALEVVALAGAAPVSVVPRLR
jgi:hypothetical protein